MKSYSRCWGLLISAVLCIGLFSACKDTSGTPDVTEPEVTDVLNPSETIAPIVPPDEVLDEPPLSKSAQKISVPVFLDEAQQLLYRRAYTLYQSMFGGDTTRIDHVGIDATQEIYREYESIDINGTQYTLSQGIYQNWADFFAVIHAVFTEDFWDSRNTAYFSEGLYTEHDGRLCFIDAAMGSGYYYNENFPDEFVLLEKTEYSISFTLIGHYSSIRPRAGETDKQCKERRAMEYEYTMEFPIHIVLTENGWRFDEFHSALADEKSQDGM